MNKSMGRHLGCEHVHVVAFGAKLAREVSLSQEERRVGARREEGLSACGGWLLLRTDAEMCGCVFGLLEVDGRGRTED